MAFRQFPDGNGDMVRLLEWDGRFFTGAQTLAHWHQVTELATRPDDVLICGYPKSGNHWLWEIVTMLKRGTAQLEASIMETHGFLMLASRSSLDSLPCPRVLVTHRRFYDLPSDFILKRRKMVCVLREPKDICVSYYHMIKNITDLDYDGSFHGFVPLFLTGYVPMGSWVGWVQSFEKGLREHPELYAHVVHYEQLQADPINEIKRLARYLECPESVAESVAERTQFSAMRKFKQTLPNPINKFYKDGKDLIFREGQVEGWRRYFSPEEAQQFDVQLMKDLGRPSIRSSL